MIYKSRLKKILAQAEFMKEPLSKISQPTHINDHILIVGEPGSYRRLFAEILHENSCYWKNRKSSYYSTKNEFFKFFRSYHKDFYEEILKKGSISKFINNTSLNGIFDDLNLCAMVNFDNVPVKNRDELRLLPPSPPIRSCQIDNIISNQRVFSEYACEELNCFYLNNLRLVVIQSHSKNNDYNNNHLFAIKVMVPPLQDDQNLKKTLINDILSFNPPVTYHNQFFNKLMGHDWNNIDELIQVLGNLGNDHFNINPPLEMQDEIDSNKPNMAPACVNNEYSGINHLPPLGCEPPIEISLLNDFPENKTDSNKPNKGSVSASKEDNDKKRQVSQEIIEKAKELDKKYPEFRKIVSNDPIIAKLKVDIHKYANNAKKITHQSPIILLMGETGTGKELFAKAYHDALENKGKFVAFSMAALSPTLIKSELFGHVKGAFTGADKDSPGLFEAATDGTIFLDEFGELEKNLQATFLRVFEEREILPVGASKNKKINAHIVLATNKNLEDMVKEKTFREDLYYRISLATVNIPPLRERRDDIPLLIDRFKGTDIVFTDKALKQMHDHQWPGNVRELRNVISAIIMTKEKDQTYINDVSSFLSNKDDKAIEKPSYDKIKNYELLIKLCKEGKSKVDIAQKISSPGAKKGSISRPTVDRWIKNIYDNEKIMGIPIQDYLRKKDKAALEFTLKNYLPEGKRKKKKN